MIIIRYRQSTQSRSSMPSIILKKTFKTKNSCMNEKTLSFHGSSVDGRLIIAINQKLSGLKRVKTSCPLQFTLDQFGHYSAAMNHDFQKYHEEDAVCIILDVMELLGWIFRFEYDSEVQSIRTFADSFTKREMFIFQKPVKG